MEIFVQKFIFFYERFPFNLVLISSTLYLEVSCCLLLDLVGQRVNLEAV